LIIDRDGYSEMSSHTAPKETEAERWKRIYQIKDRRMEEVIEHMSREIQKLIDKQILDGLTTDCLRQGYLFKDVE